MSITEFTERFDQVTEDQQELSASFHPAGKPLMITWHGKGLIKSNKNRYRVKLITSTQIGEWRI